jgi:hypothetical protein
MARFTDTGRRVCTILPAGCLLLVLGGCLRFVHPVNPASPEQRQACAGVPDCARNRVHVFLIHGLDPLDLANLEGVRDYVVSLGFLKTYYGQCFHQRRFRELVRKIHRDDPEARLVLIGFSYGACMVRDLAQAVAEDGITLDLVVYLSGSFLKDSPGTSPPNAQHVLNIRATGGYFTFTDLENAENIPYPHVFHFGSPSEPQTLERLAQELGEVAGRVPMVLPIEPAPLEEAPRPRPLSPMPPADAHAPRGDWDFLQPSGAPELPPPRKEEESFNRPAPLSRSEAAMTPMAPRQAP